VIKTSWQLVKLSGVYGPFFANLHVIFTFVDDMETFISLCKKLHSSEKS
jgi:hypothetical protein